MSGADLLWHALPVGAGATLVMDPVSYTHL